MTRILKKAMEKAIAENDIKAIKRCYQYGARIESEDVRDVLRDSNFKPETLEFIYKLGVPAISSHVRNTVCGNRPDLLKVVLTKLSNPADILNVLDSDLQSGRSYTPSYLAWAAQHKLEQVVEILLQYGAAPTFPDSQGEPPIHYALLGGSDVVINAMEAAIEAENQKSKPEPVSKEVEAEQHLREQKLAEAIYVRDMAAIEAALADNPPIDASKAAECWWMVVGTGNPKTSEIARLLLENGVSPFKNSPHGIAAFTQAVTAADVELFDMFLAQSPAHLNHPSSDYSRGQTVHMEESPLGFALRQRGYNADKFVQYLLKNHASLDAVNALGESAEFVAKRCGSPVAKRLLEEFNYTGRVPEFTVEFNPSYAAARAVEMADIQSLREMHASGSVNLAGVRIQRHTAAPEESLLEFLTTTRLPFETMREVARFLTSEVGMVPDEKLWSLNNKQSPLPYIVQMGDAELIEIMLSSMTPQFRLDLVDCSDLMYFAVSNGHAHLLRTMLKWGANPLGQFHAPLLKYLEEEHSQLANYSEIWEILDEPTKAAQAKQMATLQDPAKIAQE